MSDDKGSPPTGAKVIDLRSVFIREQQANGHTTPPVSSGQVRAGRELLALEAAQDRIKSLTRSYFMSLDTLEIYRKSGQISESDIPRHLDVIETMRKCLVNIFNEQKVFR